MAAAAVAARLAAWDSPGTAAERAPLVVKADDLSGCTVAPSSTCRGALRPTTSSRKLNGHTQSDTHTQSDQRYLKYLK